MRKREPDEACAQSVDLARDAIAEMSGAGKVGEHVGVEADGDRIVTHLFSCLDPAYRGWRWAVTLSRAARSKTVTVCESVLLPGPESVLAPHWVPWRERLLPGDLGVGDILPAPADDERLVPLASLEGADGMQEWADLAAAGLCEQRATAAGGATKEISPVPAQARVLSAAGRDDAALRWYASEHGPRSPLAHAAPGPCASCGFFARLGGPLGQLFGVCSNAYAPDDGRVVSVDHGCGAHSEALLPAGTDQPVAPVIDELGYDLVDRPGVSVDETVFESLDHG
ncbi:MAG TPA: DUF3027 domain-containing protein [Streptosporangiaceae bacterium]